MYTLRCACLRIQKHTLHYTTLHIYHYLPVTYTMNYDDMRHMLYCRHIGLKRHHSVPQNLKDWSIRAKALLAGWEPSQEEHTSRFFDAGRGLSPASTATYCTLHEPCFMMLYESLWSLFNLKLMGESISIVVGIYNGMYYTILMNIYIYVCFYCKWIEMDWKRLPRCRWLRWMLHSPQIRFRTRQTAEDLPLVPAGNLSSKCCQAFWMDGRRRRLVDFQESSND